MGKLVPVILALGGLLGGLGAGYALKPAPPECPAPLPYENPAQTVGAGSEPAGEAADQTSAAGETAPDAVNPGDCETAAAPKSDNGNAGDKKSPAEAGLLASTEFAKLPTQFVIPVLDEGRMRALVVLSITLEVRSGTQEKVFSLEPKLRDAFLRVMFRHANTGGFDGNFTNSRAMEDLRGSLFQAAESQIGNKLVAILILDIVRQDME